MSEAKLEDVSEGSSILASVADPQKRQILDTIESLGLTEKLLELEVQGFAVIPGVLSEDRIERAKAAILRRAEKTVGHKIEPESATNEDFNGMQYQHYLVFDDPVFQEILLEPKPLALVQYLLGQDCVLSSMGSHLRGPGGLPLGVHVDGLPDGCLSSTAMIANCNYALTPYSQDAGALILFPGSQHKQRQPTPAENWTAGVETLPEIMAKQLSPDELDALEWTAPPGGITMDLQPGDAVVWHGNSWHGGWRRELPGTRINLAAYFCREFMTTQELRGDSRYPEVFERHANDPRFAQLMGENRFNGWRDEGPDYEHAARIAKVQASKSQKS